MKYLKLCACALCIFWICGCGHSTLPADEEVQEIKPGEKSVITPPQNGDNSVVPALEEKPL